MLRRSSFSRRLSLEALEIRCNPSSIDLMAAAFAEAAADVPAQLATPGNRIWEYTPCCDPTAQTGTNYFNGRLLRADDLTREQASVDRPGGLPNVQVRDLQLDARNSDANGYGSNFKYVEDPSRSSIGGAAKDLLLGGDARDTPERTSHELGHTLGFRHEHTRPASDSPAAASNLNNDRFADIVTGAPPNGHVKRSLDFDLGELESIIDDLARDVASHSGTRSSGELASVLAFPGFTGGVSVAGGDVNGHKIDDIIVAAGPGAGPHIKLGSGASAPIKVYLCPSDPR